MCSCAPASSHWDPDSMLAPPDTLEHFGGPKRRKLAAEAGLGVGLHAGNLVIAPKDLQVIFLGPA